MIGKPWPSTGKTAWESLISCSGEESREGEGEEGVQEETTGLVRGRLLSSLAPKANSTVVDHRRLKTRLQKYRWTRTAIAMYVATAIELGSQGTNLRREFTRPWQSFSQETPSERDSSARSFARAILDGGPESNSSLGRQLQREESCRRDSRTQGLSVESKTSVEVKVRSPKICATVLATRLQH